MDTSELPEMDEFGLYQVVICLVISIPVLLNAGSTLGYVFTAGDMNYRCLVTECENAANTTLYPSWLESAVPYTKGSPETCSRYVMQNQSETCSESTFTNDTQSCDAWVYDPDEKTILSEWDITCSSNQWMLTLVGTINNIGQLVGLIFAGYLSDRYGRRTILMLSMLFSGVLGLIRSFSVNYWMFISLEFIDMAASAGVYSASFLLGVELVGTRRRVLGGTIICCMYAVGEIFLGLAAMLTVSWRSVLRIIYIPFFSAIILPWVVPESIRWLIARGKTDQAEKVIRKMAHMNGLKVSEEAFRKFKEMHVGNDEKVAPTEKSTEKSPAKLVLKSPIILTRLVICAFCWMTNTFVFYGLSLNSVSLSGDKYISFILVAAIEIPAYFLALLFTDKLGRKPTLCGSLLLSGSFCLAFAFIPSDVWSQLLLVLYMGGKCCITISFATIYVHTAEMFPTSLRHSLLGGCSMIGRIGSILAPQTPLLATVMESLPMILFGSMAVIAGLLSLTFPETLGTRLPDTVYDAERIGKAVHEKKPQHSPS